MVAALGLTLSRGAWIALLGGLMIWGFSFANAQDSPLFKKHLSMFLSTNLRKVLTCLLLLSTACLLVWGLSASWRINPDSAAGRLFVWKVTSQMIQEHPFLGIGTDQSDILLESGYRFFFSKG